MDIYTALCTGFLALTPFGVYTHYADPHRQEHRRAARDVFVVARARQIKAPGFKLFRI